MRLPITDLGVSDACARILSEQNWLDCYGIRPISLEMAPQVIT